MKNLLLKVLLFVTPFLLYVALVILVDPYNIFNLSNWISDADKIKVINRSNSSMPHGNLLWKTIEYERNPARCIVLGDSRFSRVNAGLVAEITGHDSVFNFSVPGGIIPTAVDLFWFANEQTKLETVFLQVGFTNYNEIVNYDLFTLRKEIFNKPLNVFTSLAILKDTYVNLLYKLTGNEKYVSEEYWDGVTDHWETKGFEKRFENYDYPESYFENLQSIKEYCDSASIELVFLIAPNYIEYQDLLAKCKMEDEYSKFVEDIKSLGICLDSGVGTEFSRDKSKYTDYVHYADAQVDSAVALMWKNYKRKPTKNE